MPMTTTSQLTGKPTSYWIDSAPATAYPALDRDLRVDVAIVGAGIVGVTAALLLKPQGAKVALIEGGSVAGGVTAYTTAKVSSAHGLHYAAVRSSFGADGARAYAQANEAALEWIAATVAELGIGCDWRRKPAYIYSVDESQRGKIDKELRAAREAGLPVSLVTAAPEL